MTNHKNYTSINTMFMTINFVKVCMQSCNVTQNIVAAVLLLPQGLWLRNLTKLWLSIITFNPSSHTTFWTCGRVRSRDKLKTFYLHYRNTYDHQTWKGGFIHWGGSFHKVKYPVDHVGLVILISLIQFAGLDCKRLNLHRHVVDFVRNKIAKNIH